MSKSEISISGDSVTVYRMLGAPKDPHTISSCSLDIYLEDYSELCNLWNNYVTQYANSPLSVDFSTLLTKLDKSQIGLLAIQIQTSFPSSNASTSTSAFLEKNFQVDPNSSTLDDPTWTQWVSIGIPKEFKSMWTYLCTHKPVGDLETITILSSDGHIIFSIFGTKVFFTPTEAVTASTGSLWQLSSDGSTIAECLPSPAISETEIIDCLTKNLIYYSQHPAPPSAVTSTRTTRSKAKATPTTASKAPTKVSAKSKKALTKPTTTNSIQSFLKLTPKSANSAETEDMEIDEDNADDDNMEIDDDHEIIAPSELPPEESATPEPLPIQHYIIEESNSTTAPTTSTVTTSASATIHATPNPIPVSSDHVSYCGPTDKVVKSSCMIISGFHCSIKNNGEIAKATHAMMNSSQIRHKLTPETNKHIKPIFHTSPNVCGYFPLELNDEYSFCRYPTSNTEKQVFQQLKFVASGTTGNTKGNPNFYHHVMAYAIPVSAQTVRTANTIGAFRGVVPNSNLIPMYIQELHSKVFQSDPNIILFPNIIGTNIAGMHDAKYLHETIIMVKSSHSISTTDLLHKFHLTRGSIHTPFLTPLTFHNDLAGMSMQLKPRQNLSPPSSVIIRHTEANSSIDVLSLVDQLKSDTSLPWNDIAAILPMDLTSKSARAIEISYLSWHPTDHVVVIHKDGSDQRNLQRAIQAHLQQHSMTELVAKNERHLPGYLDKFFRRYAGINPSPTTPQNIWTSSSSVSAGRSWASVARPTSSRESPPTQHLPTASQQSSLETLIAQQTRIISTLQERIELLEARCQQTTLPAATETAIANAFSQLTTQFESAMAQQTQSLTALIKALLDKLGGSVVPTPNTLMATTTPTPRWISESQIVAALQTQSLPTSIILPSSLSIKTNSVTCASDISIIQSTIGSTLSSTAALTLGVIHVNHSHWQPMVISPYNLSLTVWDMPGPLLSLSSQALQFALPEWTIHTEALTPYPDGDCGVVAVELLLTISHGRNWKHLDYTNLHKQRLYLENLPIDRKCHLQPKLGGSALQSTQLAPDAANPTSWDKAVALQELLYQSHSVIGTLDNSDIKMASLNINGLSDAKLPFLAWLFTKFNIDILALQDTRIAQSNWHYTAEAAKEIFPSNTMFFHSPPISSHGPSTHLVGGVALFISARCCKSPNFRGDPLKCGAICGYSFATTLGRLMVISTYFPHKSTDKQGSLWCKMSIFLPSTLTPLQHLMDIADKWSTLDEAHAGTFLLGDLNASLGTSTHGGCHNIRN